MQKIRSYLKPRSLTFWAGCLLVISAILQLAGLAIPVVSDIVRPLIETMFNATDPGTRFCIGLGLIGGRRALDDFLGGIR